MMIGEGAKEGKQATQTTQIESQVACLRVNGEMEDGGELSERRNVCELISFSVKKET